jgi:5'(3')-deoxyribonucleotidase
VDADDVVVDFIGGLLDIIKTEFDVDIKKEDIVEWNLHNILDKHIGSPGKPYSFWKHLQKREWLWAQFDAVPGAIGAIQQLRREGHYMELITSKPEWAEHNVWKWLGAWRPEFQRVTITKLEDRKADMTDADILIDDKPENCEGFIEDGRQAILFASAHNKAYRGALDLKYAANWHEVKDLIRGMASG